MTSIHSNFFYNPYPNTFYPDLPSSRFIERADPLQNVGQSILPEKEIQCTADPINHPCSLIKLIKRDKKALEDFLQKLNMPNQKQDAEKAFQALIPPLKNTFYFWFWIHENSPDRLEYGETLKSHLDVLLKIKDPYISVKGNNIVEQLIHSLDEKIELLKIKKAGQVLNRLEAQSRDPVVSNEDLVKIFHLLPKKVQYELHGKIYALSQDKPSGYVKEWGKKKLEGNVRLLSSLKEQSRSLLQLLQSRYQQNLQESLQGQKNLQKMQYETLWHNPSFPYFPLKELYDNLDSDLRTKVSLPCTIQDKTQKVLPRLPRHKLYMELGSHPTLKGTKFCIFAPHAKKVLIAITYNGSTQKKMEMNPSSDKGLWALEIEGIKPGCTYMYEIHNERGQIFWKLDPFAFKICNTPHGFNAIVSEARSGYNWNDFAWLEKRKPFASSDTPVSIYEAHVTSWKKEGNGKLNYLKLAQELAQHCKENGFTHVELFGLLDHTWEGAFSGYQPLSFFAPNHRPFTKEGWEEIKQFKECIDYLHSQEIGVIIDWIPGHFNKNNSGLRDFDGTDLYESSDHREDWGASLFDYSKEYVRNYLLSSAYFWLRELHLDGIRLDALDTILNRATHFHSVKNFMQELTSLANAEFPGVLMIAECWKNDVGITAPREKGGFGFDYKWTGASNRILEFMKRPFSERIGKLFDITDAPFQDRNEHLIWHTDHDKTRASVGSLYHQMPGSHVEKLANLRLMLSYFMTLPGKKMIFMGDELGQVQDWESRVKMGISEQPSLAAVQWELLSDPSSGHTGMKKMVKTLNHLYATHPDLYRESAENAMKWIDLKDTHNNVISFHRGNLACICNFSPKSFAEYKIYFPSHEQQHKKIKEMKEIFNSDAQEFGGSGKTNSHIDLIQNSQGETIGFKVRMPPLGCMILEERK